MVKPWDDAVIKGIKLTKFRITHHEKHGNGAVAIKEKLILQKQEKNKKRRDEENKLK